MKKCTCIISILALFVGTLFAQETSTWSKGLGTVNWNSPGNWVGGVPNIVGDQARFTGDGQGLVYLGAVTNLIGGATGSILIQTGNYTFTGQAGTTRLIMDAADDINRNNTVNVKGNLTVRDTVALTFKNSGLSGDGDIYGNVRVFANGADASVVLNGSITAETSVSFETFTGLGTVAVNGPVSLAADKGLWFNGGGTSISLNGPVTSAGGNGFVQVGSNLSLGNTAGAAISSSVALTKIVGAAYITMEADDQIASAVATAAGDGGAADTDRMWDLNGRSNSGTGILALGDAFTLSIDFSDAASETLVFDDSSAIAWDGGSTLDLVGFVFGEDSLIFGTDETGLTVQQLSQITIDGASATLSLDTAGNLVSEPVLMSISYAAVDLLIAAEGLASSSTNVLQVTTSLTSPDWSDVLPVSTGVSSNSWLVSPTNSAGFFRILSY